MTADERRLATLAVRRDELVTELTEVRKELKIASQKVELPIIVVLNGHAVHIAKGAYSGASPVCKVARCVHPEETHT